MKKPKKLTLTGKRPTPVDVEPKLLRYNKYTGEIREHAIVSFGRFNPPTKGHDLLVETMLEASQDQEALPILFVSNKEDPIKNPLLFEQKIDILESAYGDKVVISKYEHKGIVDILSHISEEFSKVTVLIGEDRFDATKKILEKYNGIYFNFEEINIVDVGSRTNTYSATQARNSVLHENYRDFEEVISAYVDSRMLYNMLEESMIVKKSHTLRKIKI